MTDSTGVFAVLTVLFCVYLIAATWRSRGVDPHASQERGARKARNPAAEQHIVRWR
jgi:hypothetical protein